MFLVLGVEVDVGYAAVPRLNNVLEMIDNNGSTYQTRQICFYEITLFPEPARRLLIVYRWSDVPKPGHHKDAVSAIETQVLNSKDCKNHPAESGVLFSLRT
jgi:hypothetical protein